MKKRLVLWVVTAVMLTMAGCGQKKDPLENVVYEDSVVQENENAEEGTADAAAQTPEEDTADAAAQTPEGMITRVVVPGNSISTVVLQ